MATRRSIKYTTRTSNTNPSPAVRTYVLALCVRFESSELNSDAVSDYPKPIRDSRERARAVNVNMKIKHMYEINILWFYDNDVELSRDIKIYNFKINIPFPDTHRVRYTFAGMCKIISNRRSVCRFCVACGSYMQSAPATNTECRVREGEVRWAFSYPI